MPDPDATTDRPRKRKWIRRVRTVVLYLIVGAIINVLVAWGCSIFVPIDTEGVAARDAQIIWNDWRQGPLAERFEDKNGNTLARRFVAFRGLGFGRTDEAVVYRFTSGIRSETESRDPREPSNRPRTDSVVRTKSACGWPYRSLFGASWKVASIEHAERMDLVSFVQRAGGIRFDRVRVHQYPGLAKTETIIPYSIATRGFICNVVFYGITVSFLLAVPKLIRRDLRRRRGLCPFCAYDLRGAEHEVCPECGK